MNDKNKYLRKLAKKFGIDQLQPTEQSRLYESLLQIEKDLSRHVMPLILDQKHPIGRSIPFTPLWIIWFADCLKEFREQPDFPKIAARLKGEEKFEEGLSVLEAACKFKRAGFEVEFDQPAGSKIPDLKLKDPETCRCVYCEVSISRESDMEIDGHNIWVRINEAFSAYRPYLRQRFRFRKIFTEQEFPSLLYQMKKLYEKALNTNLLQELIISDEFELGVVPMSQTDRLVSWARERGMDPYGDAGPWLPDALTRVKNRINQKQKQEQLSSEFINVLVVIADRLLFDETNVQQIFDNLCLTIDSRPNISVLVITNAIICDANTNRVDFMRGAFIEKKRAEKIREQYMIVFATNVLQEKILLSKIVYAFEQC